MLKSLIEGNTYLWLKCLPGKKDVIQEVVFHGYKPHPGEVLISYNGKLKSIHRRFLYPLNESDLD